MLLGSDNMKYPFVKQDGRSDCGVCSLLMIMKYFGGCASKEYLRELTKTTKEGVTAYSLLEAGKKLNFTCLGVKGDIEDLKDKDLPCIGHIVYQKSYKHFIVIYRLLEKKKQLLIADPAESKIKKISFDDWKKVSTNNYLFFTPNKKIPNFTLSSKFKNKILKFLCLEKREILILAVTSFLFSVFSIFLSFEFQILLDYVVSFNSLKNLYFFLMLFCLLLLLKEVLGYLRNLFLNYLNHTFHKKMLTDVYYHILSLPYLYYKNRTTGEIISRIQDVEKVKDFIFKLIISILMDSFMIILSTIILYFLNTQLFICVGFILFSCIMITFLIKKILYPYLEKGKEKASLVDSYLVETITGVETIKTQHLFFNIFYNFINRYNSFQNLSFSYHRISFNYQFLKSIIENYGTLILLIYGCYLIMINKLTLGEFITFQTLVSYLFTSCFSILGIVMEFQDVRLSIKRIQELYDIDSENVEVGLACSGSMDLEIKDLEYSYSGKDKLLAGVNLSIPVGSRILIYGNSGSGKSSLVKMIPRFLDYDSGNIFVSGNSIRNFSLFSLRKKICYVSQQEYLFQDSVINNICLGNNENKNKFLKISKTCMVDEIVDKNILSYDMLLEENGFNLSGGERQRIILARAILKDADIYIFDESFNEIDIERERQILKSLFEMFPEKTFIVVSHRFHNNDLFSKLYEMKDGKCYERV